MIVENTRRMRADLLAVVGLLASRDAWGCSYELVVQDGRVQLLPVTKQDDAGQEAA